jgi:hypothetical protein
MKRSIAFILALGVSAPLGAATLTVDPAGFGDAVEILHAVGAARDGDVVLVKAGDYALRAPLRFNGRSIALRSESGPESTTIRLAAGAAAASVVVFDGGEGPGAVLEGFTIQGGAGESSCGACPRRGGGIACFGASPTLRNLVLAGNRADFGGGIFLGAGAAPAIEGCVFEGNQADAGGGLFVESEGAPILRACTFRGNAATVGGGACLVDGSAALLEDCVLDKNRAEEGGGIASDGARPVLRGCRIDGNIADYGGGIHAGGNSSVRIERCSIVQNEAAWNGGGLYADLSGASIEGSRIAGNAASTGGGVYLHLAEPVEIRNCTIADNSGAGAGGVYLKHSTPEFDHVTIAGNLGIAIDMVYEQGADGALPTFRSCIVDGHVPGRASFSCVAGVVEDGGGNIGDNPRFCNWQGPAEVFVDASKSGAGDGSAERPFAGLAEALLKIYALAADSPCLRGGEGGTPMGAENGTCDAPGAQGRVVHLAPGAYPMRGLSLKDGVSVRGAGPEKTMLVGSVVGLASGAFLEGLTVTGGGGVIVGPSAHPELRRCWIVHNESRGNESAGVWVAENAGVTLDDCVIANNAGAGVWGGHRSPVTLRHCTVTANLGAGVLAHRATIDSSIVWKNAGTAIALHSQTPSAAVTRSCIEGGWSGAGNTGEDPRFCGWTRAEVLVDAAAPAGGDGSAERPFRDLDAALDLGDFKLSLQAGSPCLGTGSGGSDMGAALGLCDAPGSPTRALRLAPGTHRIATQFLKSGTSLRGSGQEHTIIEGTLRGLASGVEVADLTVHGGVGDAMVIPAGARPVIRRSTASRSVVDPRTGSGGRGIVCEDGSAPILEDCTIAFNEIAGVYCAGASPVLRSCLLTRNGPQPGSGGRVDDAAFLCVGDAARPRLERCLVVENYGLWTIFGGDRSVLDLIGCTIADNQGEAGLLVGAGAVASLKDCIVWGNAGGSFLRPRDDLGRQGSIAALYSDVEGAWPGVGNISSDPRFCGWRQENVVVDARAADGGDGSAARPYRSPAAALAPGAYRYSLSADSPCLGAGEGGADLGALADACAVPASPELRVVLRPGTYGAEDLVFFHRVRVEGTGAEATVVQGSISGVGSGSTLARLTVEPGADDIFRWQPVGVLLRAGESALLDHVTVRGFSIGIECSSSDAEISGCTLTQNGVGLRCDGGSPSLTNCRIFANNAGVICSSPSTPSLRHCTIAFNTSGILSWSGDGTGPALVNSILWGNDLGIYGPAVSRHSIAQPTPEVALWPGEGNLNVDPLFADPRRGDFRLRPESPARDAGLADGAPAFDIDGRPRPCGSGVDLGAYEYCGEEPPPARFRRGDANASAIVDLADAVFTLNHLFLGGPAAACAGAADANDSGAVDIADASFTLSWLFLGGPDPPPPGPAACGVDGTPDALDCPEAAACP